MSEGFWIRIRSLIFSLHPTGKFADDMEKLSDNRLIDLIKEDNHPAFTILVNRYWEELYRHIHARLKDEEDTRDILQEIFITAWKNRATIYTDANGTLASYLFKAARYCIIRQFSRAKQTIFSEELLENLLNQQSTTSAQEMLETKELEKRVTDELNRMPERLQIAYRLSRYAHLSNKEIASHLSLSEQTVKNNISIALHHLRLFVDKDTLLVILFLIIP